MLLADIIYLQRKIQIIIETKRLILRPWTLSDADSLYEYAKDPDIGPIAGWQPHKNVEESKHIIETVFNEKNAMQSA